jgi:hypothetical protein
MACFTLGVRRFLTKKAALVEVRRMLNAATIDRRLMGDDHVLISALYARHPRAAEKASRGMTGFMVRINSIEGALTRGFHVIHDDGSTTAFSYAPCMTASADEPRLAVAARQAIIISQREVLRNAFRGKETLPCENCRKDLTRAAVHVHHTNPRFRDILAGFVTEHGNPVIVNGTGFGDDFADPLKKMLWVIYHDRRAVCVILCASCNLAAG